MTLHPGDFPHPQVCLVEAIAQQATLLNFDISFFCRAACKLCKKFHPQLRHQISQNKELLQPPRPLGKSRRSGWGGGGGYRLDFHALLNI